MFRKLLEYFDSGLTLWLAEYFSDRMPLDLTSIRANLYIVWRASLLLKMDIINPSRGDKCGISICGL